MGSASVSCFERFHAIQRLLQPTATRRGVSCGSFPAEAERVGPRSSGGRSDHYDGQWLAALLGGEIMGSNHRRSH